MYVITDVWHFAYRPLVAWLALFFFAHSAFVSIKDIFVNPTVGARGCDGRAYQPLCVSLQQKERLRLKEASVSSS